MPNPANIEGQWPNMEGDKSEQRYFLMGLSLADFLPHRVGLPCKILGS